MSNTHFSLCKMSFNNFSSNHKYALTIQIDFCSLILYSSPIIRIQIEFINKQLLVDVDWLNKAILKGIKKYFAMQDILLKYMDRRLM